MEEQPEQSPVSNVDQAKLEAIDRHGVFLHQGVTQAFLDRVPIKGGYLNIQSVEPEFPITFGAQGAADIVVRSTILHQGWEASKLTLVVECKKLFRLLQIWS